MNRKIKQEYLPRAKSPGKNPILIPKNNNSTNTSKKQYIIHGGQIVTIQTPQFDIDWKQTIKARKQGKTGDTDRNFANINGKGIEQLINDWHDNHLAQFLNTYYFNKWFRQESVTSDTIFNKKIKTDYNDNNRKPYRVFIPFTINNSQQPTSVDPKYKLLINWLKYVLNSKDENGNNLISFTDGVNSQMVNYKGINRPIKLSQALQKVLNIKGNDYLKDINKKYKQLLLNKYKNQYQWFSQINTQGKKSQGFVDIHNGNKKSLKQMIFDQINSKDCIIDTTSDDYKKLLYSIYVNLPQQNRSLLNTQTNNDIKKITDTTTPYIICISRHPYDIYSASTNRQWGSCIQLDTNSKRFMKANNSSYLLKSANISLIAYILPSNVMKKNPRQTKEKKDILDYAIARVMINPYVLTQTNGTTFAYRSSRFLYTNLINPSHNNRTERVIPINRISQNNTTYVLQQYRGLTRVFDVIDAWLDKKMKYTTPIKSGLYKIPKQIYDDNNAKLLRWNNVQQLTVLQQHIGVPLDPSTISTQILNKQIAKFINNIIQNQKNFIIKDASQSLITIANKRINNYVMNGNKINIGKLGYKVGIIAELIQNSNIQNVISKYNYTPLSVKQFNNCNINNCFVNTNNIYKCNISNSNLSLDESQNLISNSTLLESSIASTDTNSKITIKKSIIENGYINESNVFILNSQIKDSQIYNINQISNCQLHNCSIQNTDKLMISNCSMINVSCKLNNATIKDCYICNDSLLSGNNVKVVNCKFQLQNNNERDILVHVKVQMDLKTVLKILQSNNMSNLYLKYDQNQLQVVNK